MQNSTSDAFTEAEQEALAEMLGLTSAKLGTLVQACTYVMEKAAYLNCSSDELSLFLQEEAELEKAHAECFGATWEEEGQHVVSKYQSYTIGCPHVLSSVDWQLRMNLAQSKLRKRKGCVADIKFALSSGDSTSPESSQVVDRFAVEFDHSELYQFFLQIEAIQASLDGLS